MVRATPSFGKAAPKTDMELMYESVLTVATSLGINISKYGSDANRYSITVGLLKDLHDAVIRGKKPGPQYVDKDLNELVAERDQIILAQTKQIDGLKETNTWQSKALIKVRTDACRFITAQKLDVNTDSKEPGDIADMVKGTFEKLLFMAHDYQKALHDAVESHQMGSTAQTLNETGILEGDLLESYRNVLKDLSKRL
jgi:hypothetical protein